ncbi:MAG: DUF2752 domain-containing protein [Chitinophagaceae bacterium]
MFYIQSIFKYLLKHIELLFFSAAIITLYCMDVATTSTSFCVFKWIGFNSCFGCGIGHSIHYALHFQFLKSFQAHPLGIFAICIILCRIFTLVFKNQNHQHARKLN